MLPKVSIIIPTYNRENVVCDAIDSALAQQYDNLEIVIMDNDSKDNTQNVIKPYLSNPMIKYIKNEKNMGCYPSVNKALVEHITGEYFLVLSDDDILMYPFYVREAVNLFSRDKDTVMIYADWQSTELESGQVISSTDWHIPDGAIVNGVELWKLWPGVFAYWGVCVFKTNIVLRVGGFWCNFTGMDSLLITRMFLEGNVGFIKKIILNTRELPNNGTKELMKSLDKQYRNIDYIRIASLSALDKGISEEMVAAWKEHNITCLIANILINVYRSGDKEQVNEKLGIVYRKAVEHGDEKCFVLAMSRFIR